MISPVLMGSRPVVQSVEQGRGSDQLPVVVIAAREDQAAGAAAGVTDWLIKPFDSSYARTKIRAWVLRLHAIGLERLFPPMRSTTGSIARERECSTRSRRTGSTG